MGIDNMLAVGAASHGNLFLLLFGLLLSIPMVVFMSTWLSRLMDRYPIILWIGAAVLGKVGGEMMITDPGCTGCSTRPSGASMPRWPSSRFLCAFSKWVIAARGSKSALEHRGGRAGGRCSRKPLSCLVKPLGGMVS